MTLKRRIKALEANTGTELTVFGNTPVVDTIQQAEAALRAAAIAQGIKPPFTVLPVQIESITEVEITGTGSLTELLENVAKYGKKLGRQKVQKM